MLSARCYADREGRPARRSLDPFRVSLSMRASGAMREFAAAINRIVFSRGPSRRTRLAWLGRAARRVLDALCSGGATIIGTSHSPSEPHDPA